MITPAYSPTATERVLPRMALDFTTASLDSRVTITRALNTATAVNSAGFIAVVNANLPRFDYDPVTLACKGLLIEESRTNLTAHSQNPSDLNWSGTACTKTSTNNADPFNTSTALLLTADGTSAGHFLAVGITATILYTSGTTYTISCFVKAGTTNRIQLTGPGAAFGTGQYANFLLTGAGSITASAGGTATISQAPNGFYRITFSVAATATIASSGGILVFITTGSETRLPTNTSSSSIVVIGWQTEAGAFATSYIPTTTGSVTRNADQVVMTGTNFSSWYNASQSTLMTEASTFSNASTDKFVANINNNGFPNRILMNFTATNNFSASLVSNSISQVSGTNGVAAALNTPIKMCFATKLDSFAFSQSGVTPTTDNLGVMPVTVDRLWIGSAFTSAFLNGHMRQIKYWPQRLINAETQAFSK